jgi:hypothetical protein
VQPEVIQQRITAARHLRGKLQSDLDRELAAYGFSLKEAGELERGAKTLQPKHVRPLAEILQVPEAWFTSEHLDMTGPTADDTTDLLHGTLVELHQVARRALEVAVENNDMLNRAITSRDLDIARVERTVAALTELVATRLRAMESVDPAPRGELGRRAEGSRSTGEDRRRGERRRARDGA